MEKQRQRNTASRFADSSAGHLEPAHIRASGEIRWESSEYLDSMRQIERALQAAWKKKPANDPEGLWRQGWVCGWLAGIQTGAALPSRSARMIALGIDAGLEVQPQTISRESEWRNWAKLWAMIWTQSWVKQLKEMQAEGLTPLMPEALADRVLAAAIRLVKSLQTSEF